MRKLFINIVLILALLSFSSAQAQEKIVDFEKKDLPILNEELRKINTTLRNLISYPLAIISGGTGKTTAQTAIDALLPSQTGNSGKFLTTNATTSSWGSISTYNQLFTSSGTFTAPTGVTMVYVTLVGGGGGGQGGSGDPNYNAGGGGGGGETIIKCPYTVTSGNYTVTVGTKGTGGNDQGSAGSAGGTSSFDTSLSVAGGAGGASQTGGNGGNTSGTRDASGTTTPVAGTRFQFDGGNGSNGTANGNYSGSGGGSCFGSGGVGKTTIHAVGDSGTGYGSGGGGGMRGSLDYYGAVGGDGTAGFVLVEW